MKVVVLVIILWMTGSRDKVSCYNSAARNSSLCPPDACKLPNICTWVIDAPSRCVPVGKQVFLLQPPIQSWNGSAQHLREMERDISNKYIRSVYNHTGDISIRQDLESNLTVEVLNTTLVQQNIYTTLVMLYGRAFTEWTEACQALSRTSTPCVSSADCDILRAANIDCPATYPPVSGTVPPPVPVLTGGVIALIVAVGAIILLLLAGCITLKVCKRKHKGSRRGHRGSDPYNNFNSTTDQYRGTERTNGSLPPLADMFQPTTDMSMYKHQFDMEMEMEDMSAVVEDRSVSHTLSGGVAAVAAIEIQRVWRGYRTRKLVYAVLSPSPSTLTYLSFNRASPTYQGIRGTLNLYPLIRRAHSLVHKSMGELAGELPDNRAKDTQQIVFRGFSPWSIEQWWRAILEYVDWFQQLEWGNLDNGQLSEFDGSLIIQKAWSGPIDENRTDNANR